MSPLVMDRVTVFSQQRFRLCVRLLNFSQPRWRLRLLGVQQPRLRLSVVTNMMKSIVVSFAYLKLYFSTFIDIYYK